MKEKPKELTEEEKHRLKVQRENLEREKRMQKRKKQLCLKFKVSPYNDTLSSLRLLQTNNSKPQTLTKTAK